MSNPRTDWGFKMSKQKGVTVDKSIIPIDRF